jgi:hypothetical protein
MLSDDIVLVDQEMLHGGVWSHRREAWSRIKIKLSEVQKPSDNSVSREMPGVKTFESAYDAHSIKETGHRATEDELDIVRFCHNFIARHFGQ